MRICLRIWTKPGFYDTDADQMPCKPKWSTGVSKCYSRLALRFSVQSLTLINERIRLPMNPCFMIKNRIIKWKTNTDAPPRRECSVSIYSHCTNYSFTPTCKWQIYSMNCCKCLNAVKWVLKRPEDTVSPSLVNLYSSLGAQWLAVDEHPIRRSPCPEVSLSGFCGDFWTWINRLPNLT